jgi:hypothetical protein
MESREEPRFETHQEITVTLLGDRETSFPGKIVNLSVKGLCLQTNYALSPGAALKIEMADTLVLGEVVYCRRSGTDFHLGISLEQALYHTRDVAALAQRLLGSGNWSRAYDKEVTPL